MTAAAGIALNTPVHTVASNVNARDEAQELFEAHGASLFRFARVMLRTPQDAEDVVQTTFVRLLDHLARGGARSNLKAWLFSVTANLCRDQLRARRRWLGLLPERDRLLSTPPALESRDPIELFLTVVRTLTPRDRLLLALKAQGLSYREIAAAAAYAKTPSAGCWRGRSRAGGARGPRCRTPEGPMSRCLNEARSRPQPTARRRRSSGNTWKDAPSAARAQPLRVARATARRDGVARERPGESG